jgi:DNA-binding LacI/PurR family transcriptional regulator
VANSAEVAAKAGVSRSTVSQILNGHEHRFRPDMVEHVRTVARELGYRPSIAGRSLARGTSDIVITLVPNITFGPRLRDLIDQLTQELAVAGKTNLLRLASSIATLDQAILDVRPAGVLSISPLTADLRSRLLAAGINVVEQTEDLQQSIDRAIGAAQAAHLAGAGYARVCVALPQDLRERPYAAAREAGVLEWCRAHGFPAAATLRVTLDKAIGPGILPVADTGVAAYNDDVALAILAAAHRGGRAVPDDLGIIGVDNSGFTRITEPSLASVDFDTRFSATVIARALLDGPESMPVDPLPALVDQIRVIPGGSTRAAPGPRSKGR